MGNNAFLQPFPVEEGGYGDTGDTALYSDGRLVGRSGVPGDGRFTVPARQANYRLLRSVEVSHDDGVTWKPAELCKVGGAWLAIVTHPSAGFVSLRATIIRYSTKPAVSRRTM